MKITQKLKEETPLYKQLIPLIQENDSEAIEDVLIDYGGELGELEQELGCQAVKRFRKGRDPLALLSLAKAGFNLLGRNSLNSCPFEDMIDFWNWARSRKEEAASVLWMVLEYQYEQFIQGIREQDTSHAVRIDRVLKAVKPIKRRCKRPSLARMQYPLFWMLAAAGFGIVT